MKDIEYMYEIIKEKIIKLKNKIHTLDCLVEEGKQCILIKRDKKGCLSRCIRCVCVKMPTQKPFDAVSCLLL